MCYLTLTRTLEDTDEDPQLFCPLTKENCNVHCMWLVKNTHLTEKGIEVFHQCTMLNIFDVLLDLAGAHEEEDNF